VRQSRVGLEKLYVLLKDEEVREVSGLDVTQTMCDLVSLETNLGSFMKVIHQNMILDLNPT